MALGPWIVPGPYELLRPLPGFASLRTPSRMFPLAVIGLGAASALTLAALARRPRLRWLLAPLVLLALWESVPRGLARDLGPLPPPPPCNAWLAGAPRGPVAELPWRAAFGAEYLYWSTVHDQPLVNGWGAYAPPENVALLRLGRRWPSPDVVEAMRAFGVRYVVRHVRRRPEKPAATIRADATDVDERGAGATPTDTVAPLPPPTIPERARLVYSDDECRVIELAPAEL